MSCTKYGTASFNAIEFEVLGVSESGGRRIVTHKYPFSNAHYNEDLGDEPVKWSVSGCFHGKDFRRKLMLAKIAWGLGIDGVFFEPTQNMPHLLRIKSKTFKYDEKRLDYVEFTLELIETGNDPYTSNNLNIVGIIDGYISDAMSAFTNLIGG